MPRVLQVEIIAQVIDDLRAKAEGYLQCAEALAQLLKEPQDDVTVATPTHLPAAQRIVAALREHGELGVAALATTLQLKRPAVSIALARLREAGVVQKRGENRHAVYALAADQLQAPHLSGH